eukprot:g2656.t1
MWAGGSVTFESGIPVGSRVKKTVRVSNVSKKQSKKNGDMMFVTRESVLEDDASGCLRIVDTTDHVYLSSVGYAPPHNPPVLSDLESYPWRRQFRADPVSLFRFSALTWNSHRIHYDESHTRSVEGYPDLVVHGPMLAMLLLDLFQSSIAPVLQTDPYAGYTFTYRGIQPAFVGRDLAVVGKISDAVEGDAELYAVNEDSEVCMRAKVTRV